MLLVWLSRLCALLIEYQQTSRLNRARAAAREVRAAASNCADWFVFVRW